jgi:hypothetical protein
MNRDKDTFQHPINETELINLIDKAKLNKSQIRVRGAAHSVLPSIYVDTNLSNINKNTVNIMLDKFNQVIFDDSKMQVIVGAGCHLGKNPLDPTYNSTIENSLFSQLDKKGWALHDTGGITHQTVGGFISTGSSGGSLTYSIEDNIIGIRFIDGNGNIHEVNETDEPNLFHAVGVSMGLLGIITEVKLQCIPKYNIKGNEAVTKLENSELKIFEKDTLEHFLNVTPYSRLLWWPQEGVQKLAIWQAERILAHKDFKRKPFSQFPVIAGIRIPLEVIGGFIYTILGNWQPVIKKMYKKHPFSRSLLRHINTFISKYFSTKILPPIINTFVESTENSGSKNFEDTWWQGLPMDNEIDYRYFPVDFTELWIPIESATDVVTTLRDYYEKVGLKAVGTFCCEIYAAKKSKFWLSPSYQQDVIRIDLFWFSKNKAHPSTYYQQFWDLLKPFNFRCHWGKHLPFNIDDQNHNDIWRSYLHKQYTKWDSFLAHRELLDPQQIFVNNYWRTVFDIKNL